MDVDEVDMAPVAQDQEALKPGKSVLAIRDGRRAQVHLGLKLTLRLHPLLPCICSGVGAHADSAPGTGTCC